MAITIKRDGFPQVEPNHLSAPRNGQVYAQLPVDASIEEVYQGQFLCYNAAEGKCDFGGKAPWMMAYNEEKLYDERHQMHKDFALQKGQFFDGQIVPRLFKLSVGDIYTTNCVKEESLKVGDKLQPGAKGILEKVSAEPVAGKPALMVVKETVMPDGQPAVKLQVISE